MNRPLLILDLDETLIHATERSLNELPGFRVGRYGVYRRPHLAAFLDYCFTDYEVAVWTSAGSAYAAEVVAQIFPRRELRFCWSAERCTQRTHPLTREYYSVKDLKKVRKLGFALEQVLMVDDSPEKLERQYGNHIHVSPFEGAADDAELLLLAKYLQRIRPHPNYRTLEKRGWRDLIQ